MSISSLEKKQLHAKLEEHEKALKEKLSLFPQRDQDTVSDIVLMGGSLVMAYLAVRRLVAVFGAENDEESHETSQRKPLKGMFSTITDVVITRVLVTTLSVLKEQLSAHLRKMDLKQEKTEVDSDAPRTI